MKKKTNKKSSHFLSGALVGAVLGVAAEIFATSEKGKEMEGELKDKMVGFYKSIAPKIKKAKTMGEKEYKAFISKALVNYNKNGEFSEKDIKNIAKEAQDSWKHLKKHLKEE